MNRRLHMLLGGLFALSPLTIAMAQETASDAEQTEEVERIQVTGSNIRGVDLEGAQPLQVIDAEEIARSGANTVFELLRNLGQTRGGQGTFDTATSGGLSTSTPAGQAAASLRGLGPSSTLTLINGRRVAPSSFAAGTENFVDINSIPLAAIERVEVLATGASAIYGADAVAGVINYILKDDYDGAEINAFFEDSAASSDESSKNVNIVWGGDVGGGNLTLFADLFDRNAFEATDRDFSRDPLLQSTYSYLSKLPYPNIYFNSSNISNPNGGFSEVANPNCPVDLTETALDEQICAYYPNQDTLLNSELESQSVGAIYSKEFGNIQWNTDFFFSRTKSVAVSTPAAIDQVDNTEGAITLFSNLDIYSEEQLQAWQGTSFIDDIVYGETFGTQAGRDIFGFRYDARFEDPRTIENETTSFRLVSSLTGEFDNGWQWDTGITISQSKSEQVGISGIYNRYKYNAAAQGELCSDGSIANYDADTDVLSCSGGNLLPAFNPFLIGDADNNAVLAVAQEMPTRDGKSTVYGIDARFNGELMEFGDDYIRAAFGVEFRREDLEDLSSDNARANFENEFLVDVFGFGSSQAEADRTQWGAFAEFHIPFTDQLDVQIAGRYDHYDDFGGTFNPKFSFTYRPVDELILRGSWATSFRAPSLTQAGVELRTTTTDFDCRANSEVNRLFCGGEGFIRQQFTLELGNPLLEAEESDSISLGIAWSPTENSTLTIDYWRFDHERIVDTNLTEVLARSINDASLRHCGAIPEGETGISFNQVLCDNFTVNGLDISQEGADVEEISRLWDENQLMRDENLGLPIGQRDHVILLENTGTQIVEGIDVDFFQDFDVWGGTFSIDANLTHYLSFERNLPGSTITQEFIGTFSYPENVGNLSFFYEQGDYSGGIFIRFVDGYTDNLERLRGRNIDELVDLGVLAEGDDSYEIASWTTVDVNFNIEFENSQLRLNVDNIFDRDPPVSYSSRLGFDAFNHNGLGTTVRVGYSYFF